MAQVLARAFPSIDALAKATDEDLNGSRAIGPEIAGSIFEWFHDKENLKLLKKLREGRRPHRGRRGRGRRPRAR